MIINSKNKKTVQICLFVLVAILALGIGYAAISNISLLINSTRAVATVNQENFKVHFTEAQNITGTTGVGGTSIIDDDDTKASFTVTGLVKTGDYAEAKYVVKNDSNGIGAEITLNLTNSNPEYFKVTETVQDNKLQAGDTTLATVKVEMIKTPITDSVSTSITATLVATPIENTNISNIETITKESQYETYTISNTRLNINSAMPNNVPTSNNFATLTSNFFYPKAILHEVENDIIKKSYVVYEENSVLYKLRGGVDESSLPDSDKVVYNHNKEVLNGSPVGSSCRESTNNNVKYYFCNYHNYQNYIVRSNGEVSSNYDDNGSTIRHIERCEISSTGQSYCTVEDHMTGPS